MSRSTPAPIGASVGASLRPAEFQSKHRIGKTKFFEMVKAGDLRTVKAGRNITLITAAEEARWLASLPAAKPSVEAAP